MSIARNQRIEGPKDQLDSGDERMLSLCKFYPVSEISVAQTCFNREHMGMICDGAITQGDGRVSEGNEAARSGERADSRRIAGFGDLVQPYRHYVDVVIPPNAPFKIHAFLEIFERDAFSYCKLITSHKNRV